MSGLLSFEWRTCECGKRFEALKFWSEDAPCDSCGRKRYDERVAALNERAQGRFTIRTIGGACPTQAEGFLSDGRPYYFRARHDEWALHVGAFGDPDDYCSWTQSLLDDVLVEGEDPSGGYMSDEEVFAILEAHCA